jgi:outer membrane immunogenic protein
VSATLRENQRYIQRIGLAPRTRGAIDAPWNPREYEYMPNRKFFALTFAAALLGAGTAHAADLQRAPIYTKAPPPAAVFNWTGFYIGANIGYSAGHTDAGAIGTAEPNGVVGGGQIGYNWQGPSSPWVFGVELDGQGTGQDDSASAVFPAPLGTVTASDSLPWFFTARGRIGYAFAPMFMVYATGGAAVVDHKFQVTTGLGTATSEESRVGWTLGAGIEGAFARNWSWKAEYLHLDTGTFDTTFFGVLPVSLRVTDDIGRVGVNYHF